MANYAAYDFKVSAAKLEGQRSRGTLSGEISTRGRDFIVHRHIAYCISVSA